MSARRAPRNTATAERPTPLSPRTELGAGAHFAKLFRKIEQGRYEASLFDGRRIEVGVAPEVDLALAKTYYEQSAAQGYQLAIDNLARLNEGGRPSGGGKTKSK